LRINSKNFKNLLICVLIFLNILINLVPILNLNPRTTEINFFNNESKNRDDNKEYFLKDNNSGKLFNNYTDIAQRRIYFPLTHEQTFTPWDTGFFGYSELAILLEKYHIEVSTITQSLSQSVENMTSNDILFLNVAKYGKYSKNEIGNITNFVARGGKIIIHGEHYIFNLSIFQNKLLKYFDMQITDLDIVDDYNHVYGNPAWNRFNSTFFGLTNLSIMFGSVLNITGPNAFSIANSSKKANFPNQPIMGGYIHPNNSEGKVFCCTDSEWVWNTNKSIPGIQYGNNSKLILRVLDWFYNTSLGKEIEKGLKVTPDFNLFSGPTNSNFTLNITLTKKLNVSLYISGGSIFPKFGTNLVGKTNWNVHINKDGYIKFFFTKDTGNINFSTIIYFFASNGAEKVLFLQNNYSRQINPTPDGLLKLACDFKTRNFSVFASNKILNYSDFYCVIVANPLESYNLGTINLLNQSNNYGTKIIFLNVPYTSLDMEDSMYYPFKAMGFYSKIPINEISIPFGITFIRYIVGDSENNIGDKLFFPKILGINSTYYGLSCYFAAVINFSSEFKQELMGYTSAWGEYRTIFGTSGWMGEHIYDVNQTCVMAYTNKTLGSGLLYYFVNQFYNSSKFFNNYFFNWIKTGKFNRKYTLQMNRTVEDFYYKNIDFQIFPGKKIRNLNGNIVPNGTIFNVIMTKGKILSQDALPSKLGFQIKIFNGTFNLKCSSKFDIGLCEIAIYNSTDYKIILSLLINFYSPPSLYKFDNNPSPNGNVTLKWKGAANIKTYYIFRHTSRIIAINNSILITNVSKDFYRDNLTSFGKYYYVIVGSNYIQNTSISNCVSINIHPVLLLIVPNPNSNGKILLRWNSLIGAKTYYILRYNFNITINNFQDSMVKLLGNVSTNYFTDNLNIEQGKTYYYVIIGSDYLRNSSISNCVSVLINIIPEPPKFETYDLKFYKEKIKISWDDVSYAIGYKIYFSSKKDFNPTEKMSIAYITYNFIIIDNLEEGIYYLKVKSVGIYGNSSYSDELTIEIIIRKKISSDNPWPLLIMILIALIGANLIIFSYFWIYFNKFKKINKKKKQNNR